VTVSVDLNYRAQLWQWGATPREVMTDVARQTDVIFGNEEDLEKVFGISVPTLAGRGRELDPRAYESACAELRRMFPQLQVVALSLRTAVSASDNFWTGVLATADGFFTAHRYHIAPVLDRLGAGDAFAAGIIRGLVQDTGDPQAILDFAVAASCLKHSIRGDFNLVGAAEVLRLAAGDASGRIVR
jgi:2-dehydro-3-deoxygluconokinase